MAGGDYRGWRNTRFSEVRGQEDYTEHHREDTEIQATRAGAALAKVLTEKGLFILRLCSRV
jgi:hypothetical protein